MSAQSQALRLLLAFAVVSASPLVLPAALHAQAPATASQVGTVKSVSPTAIVVETDAKSQITVTPADGARILQLAPGSRDLKSAPVIPLSAISPGDRVLVTGHASSDPSSFNAARIILMKGSAIASLHASQAADWQRRGTGGLVRSVEGNTITVSNGPRTLTVDTTPSTVYRRYAGDSVKFEDAKPGTLAEIHPGDQLRVRGDKSADGNTVTAEEIVSGSFQNLAGVVSKVDPADSSITLKDLATKQTVTVQVTPNSNLRHLPAQAAAMFARSHAAGAAGATPASAPEGSAGVRRAGMDLSQLLSRLPTQPLSELKPGDAVLIVASRTGDSITAVTMLSGVEPILSASPGAAAPTLSPWNLGTGEEMGGGGEGGGPGGAGR